jgi:hypothetical protein
LLVHVVAIQFSLVLENASQGGLGEAAISRLACLISRACQTYKQLYGVQTPYPSRSANPRVLAQPKTGGSS